MKMMVTSVLSIKFFFFKPDQSPPKIKLEFDNVIGNSKDLSNKGCRPLFALVRDGKGN